MSIVHAVRMILAGFRGETAGRWRVHSLLGALLYLAPFVVIFGAGVLRLVNKPLMLQLTAEDGLVEWIQVAGFAVAALFSVLVAIHMALRGGLVMAVLYAGLALGLFFIVGEELAWGQRLLQFSTPDALAQVNDKGELSVHNITSLTSIFLIGKWAAGVYGTLGFGVLWWLRRLGSGTWLQLVVVPFFLSSPFLIVLLLRVFQVTLLGGKIPVDYGEFDEVFLAYGLASFVVFTWRRLRWLGAAGPVGKRRQL